MGFCSARTWLVGVEESHNNEIEKGGDLSDYPMEIEGYSRSTLDAHTAFFEYIRSRENPCGKGNLPRKCTCLDGKSYKVNKSKDDLTAHVETCGPIEPASCV